MRRSLLALVLVAVTALGAVVFNMGAAPAWKCNVHPEQPTCTTLPPPPTVPNTTERTTTTEPVTYTVPSTTPTPEPSTSTSTSTSVPDDPPTTALRFAG